MTELLLIIFAGVAESVVWLWRLRSGVGASRLSAAGAAAAVCACRVLFTGAGFAAAMAGSFWIAGAAYCLAAFGATWLVFPMGVK